MSSQAIGPFALIAFSLAGVALVVWGATIGKAEFIVEDYDAGPLEQFVIGQIVAFDEPGLYVFGREDGQLRVLDGLIRRTGCRAQWLPDDSRASSANPDGASGAFADPCSEALWAMTGRAIVGTDEPLRTFTYRVRAGPDGADHIFIEVIERDPNRNAGGN